MRDSLVRGALVRLPQLVPAAAAVAFMLGVWWFVNGFLVNPALVPSPREVFALAGSMLADGTLLGHVASSLRRILVGYVFGCAVGVLGGLLIGRLRLAQRVFSPMMELIRPISPVALVPVVMIWFGIGEFAKYFLIAYTSIIIILINTVSGVLSTPLIRQRAAQCLGANELQIFLYVVIPSTLPYILTGMRIGLGFSFMSVVAAELIAADSGIGFLIMQARLSMFTQQMFVGLVTLGVIGALTDLVFRAVIERVGRRYMQDVLNV